MMPRFEVKLTPRDYHPDYKFAIVDRVRPIFDPKGDDIVLLGETRDDVEGEAMHLNSMCKPCGCFRNVMGAYTEPCEQHARVFQVTEERLILALNTDDAITLAYEDKDEDAPPYLILRGENEVTEIGEGTPSEALLREVRPTS